MKTIKVTSGLHEGTVAKVLEEYPQVCAYVRTDDSDFAIDWQDFIRATVIPVPNQKQYNALYAK